MKEDTMKKESTGITDIATAIERSLENLPTGLNDSKGFAIVFVSTTDDGTMHGGSVFGKISNTAMSSLCLEALKTTERVIAKRAQCDCPDCRVERASQTTH